MKPAKPAKPTRFGVPEELAAEIERLLPGGKHRTLRYQLRAATRVILAWDKDASVLTVTPLTPAEAVAKEKYIGAFLEWMAQEDA